MVSYETDSTLQYVQGEPRRELALSDEMVWKAQQEDAEIQELYRQVVEHGEVTINGKTKVIILEDNVYRMLQLPHKTLYQVDIPESLRIELLQLSHDDHLAGHLGRFKTCKRLQTLVYWAKLSKQVKDFVRACQVCQKYEPEGPQHTTGKRPWERIGLDLMGPFPRSSERNVCLLVYVDNTSLGGWNFVH